MSEAKPIRIGGSRWCILLQKRYVPFQCQQGAAFKLGVKSPKSASLASQLALVRACRFSTSSRHATAELKKRDSVSGMGCFHLFNWLAPVSFLNASAPMK